MRLPAADGPKSLSNPALKLAMDTLRRQGTGAAEQLFIRELERARLLAPVVVEAVSSPDGPEGQAALTEKTRVRFQSMLTQEGRTFFPSFTDWKELRGWNQEKDRRVAVTTLEDYCNLILEQEQGPQGLVINPFHQNIVVSKAFLTARKCGVTPYTVEKDPQLLLGDPAEYPSEMAAAISGYLSGQAGVRAAWLRLMVRDREKYYLIVLELTHREYRGLFDGIAGAATPFLKGMQLKIIPLEDGFSYRAVQDTAPFFIRE